MPQRLAIESARMLSYCKSDEEVRDTARQGLLTAAAYGFNHGNPEFVRALCEDLRELADGETDATRKRRLLTAVETVCALADELSAGAAPA